MYFYFTKGYQSIIWFLLSIQSFVYSFTYRIASRVHPLSQLKITNSIKNLLGLIQQYKEMKHTDETKILDKEKIPTTINLYMDHDPKQNAMVQYKKEKEKTKYDWIRNYYTNTAIYHKMEEIYEQFMKKSL